MRKCQQLIFFRVDLGSREREDSDQSLSEPEYEPYSRKRLRRAAGLESISEDSSSDDEDLGSEQETPKTRQGRHSRTLQAVNTGEGRAIFQGKYGTIWQTTAEACGQTNAADVSQTTGLPLHVHLVCFPAFL